MADQSLSAQAGPVNDLYELGNETQRPPIPPKQPETNPARSPSGFAPQPIDQQQRQQYYSPSGIAPNPESPIRTSHSPQPPQGHLSLVAPSTVSAIDSYRGSYQTRPDSGVIQSQYGGSEASYGNNPNAAAAPHYNAPVTGYYGSDVQYNPNQSYGVAPYPQAQSPPPVKAENIYSAGPPPPPVPPTGPPAGVVVPAEGGDKMKKRICGMTVTIFLVLCVILFLVVAGAILGGVMGVLKKKHNNPTPSPVTTSGPTSTKVFPPTTTTTSDTNSITSTPTTTTTTNYAYPIPTGTWTITGGLSLTTGTCINDLNTTNYKEVWYCPENQTETVVIRDYSSTDKFVYYLDMDTPTRVRGVSGTPPTGMDATNGKSPFWTFSVKYQQQAPYSKQGDCEVNVDLLFLLGRAKTVAGFLEQVDSPNVCMQPGGNSTAGVSCTCGYISGSKST